jgi:hypothetical protein
MSGNDFLSYLLMGAQASGTIVDIFAQNASRDISRAGQQLEESQMELRIKQERIASNEQSIQNLEILAETLATQRALMSIRGGTPGMGSNLSVENKAVNMFNRDERVRALSLEFAEQNRRAQISVSRIALAGKEAEQGAKNFAKAFDMIPFAEMGTKVNAKKGTKTGAVKLDSNLANWNKGKTGLLTG